MSRYQEDIEHSERFNNFRPPIHSACGYPVLKLLKSKASEV